MLTFAATDTRDSIGVGHKVRYYGFPSPQTEYYTWTSPKTYSSEYPWGYSYDLWRWNPFTLLYHLGFMTGQELIRIEDDKVNRIVLGDRRPQCERVFNAVEDGGRYGSLLGVIRRLASATATNRRRNWTRESDIFDPSARGLLQLETEAKSAYWNRGTLSLWNWTLPKFVASQPTSFDPAKYGTNIRYLYPDNPTGFYLLDNNGWSYGISQVFPEDFVAAEEVYGPINIDIQVGNIHLEDVYHNFGVYYDGDVYSGSVTFSYDWDHEVTDSRRFSAPVSGYPWSRSKWRVSRTMSYRHTPKPAFRMASMPVNGYIDVDQSVSFHRKYEMLSFDSIWAPAANMAPWCNSYEADEVVNTTVRFTPLCTTFHPGLSTLTMDDHVRAIPVLKGYRTADDAVHKFSKLIESIHHDIRPATALSANNCLENYQSDSNFLESVPDMPGMIRQIKDVSRFGSLVKEISAGNPKAIPHAVDLLADGYLAYKYGARPTLSDISEARRIAQTYMDQLDILSADLPPTLYGEFEFDIPEQLDGIPGSFKVYVRSKMVLRASVATYLAYIMAMDGVGMLPTLARIWDLVPFSFVIDWFTSLGDRFEDIDHFVARMALDVDYYVHTFEYVYKLHSRSYAPFQPLESNSAEPPQLRAFKRERSLFHPMLGMNSKYDFHPPKGLRKNVLAAGALLWSS